MVLHCTTFAPSPRCFFYTDDYSKVKLCGKNMEEEASHDGGAHSVHVVLHIYKSTTNVFSLWKEKMGAEAPRHEALVIQVVPTRMDKAGAIACLEALVGAQGEVSSTDSIRGVQLLHSECVSL
jgi:hypothetical protein